MAFETGTARSRSHVECDQVLHGYSDGHQLLAASISLPRNVRTRMLLLTDLSGPSVTKGFDSYLTGYPLTPEKLYAFSRTWYAEEMPRPGCVWTHTLLISPDTLVSLSDLSVLNQLFFRPTTGNIDRDFSAYQTRIVTDLELKAPLLFEGADERLASLIGALYGQPRASVVMGARREAECELAVLRIWSQQWPHLRQSFTFCTGSLGRRNNDDTQFDLQIVPESHLRQFRRDVHLNITIVEDATTADREATDWVRTSVDDLVCTTNTPLRKFLWEFGGDHEEGRAVFEKLCRIYILLKRGMYDDAQAVQLLL